MDSASKIINDFENPTIEEQKSSETRYRSAQPSFTDEESAIIEKAKEDGTYLKAPNGKDTKLTPKQWAQVRTNAFKEWVVCYVKDTII